MQEEAKNCEVEVLEVLEKYGFDLQVGTHFTFVKKPEAKAEEPKAE